MTNTLGPNPFQLDLGQWFVMLESASGVRALVLLDLSWSTGITRLG